MLGAFAKHRKYWEKLCDLNNRTRQSGLKVTLTHEGYRMPGGEDFEYSDESFYYALPLRFYNVPVAMTREECGVYILNAKNARRMSEAEVRELLKKPVLTDGEAIRVLCDRGFDVGASAQAIDPSILTEQFTDHAVNAGMEGHHWCGRWMHNSDWELLGDGVEAVSKYVTSNGVKLDREHIATGVFTTPAGAKWASTFNLWTRGISSEKRNQLLNMMAYISGSRFAAELVTPIQAVVHPRVDEEGRLAAVSVTNVTVGDSGELELILRNPVGTKFTYISQYSDEAALEGEEIGNGEYRVKIPDLHGWSVGTVFAE